MAAEQIGCIHLADQFVPHVRIVPDKVVVFRCRLFLVSDFPDQVGGAGRLRVRYILIDDDNELRPPVPVSVVTRKPHMLHIFVSDGIDHQDDAVPRSSKSLRLVIHGNPGAEGVV